MLHMDPHYSMSQLLQRNMLEAICHCSDSPDSFQADGVRHELQLQVSSI